MDMKDDKSWKYNLTFASDFKRNVTFNVSGVQVPTDIYNEGMSTEKMHVVVP